MSQSTGVLEVESFPVADNVSYTGSPGWNGPSATESLLLHTPKVALGLGLLFLLVVVKALRGGRKYPAGVKPLPKHAGNDDSRFAQLELG